MPEGNTPWEFTDKSRGSLDQYARFANEEAVRQEANGPGTSAVERRLFFDRFKHESSGYLGDLDASE